MNKVIVSTSIDPPSDAYRKFAEVKGWQFICVGDLKTPHQSYREFKNCTYLDPDDQKKLFPKLSESLGWYNIQRRNIGFAYAHKIGADLIASVDSDNEIINEWPGEILIDKEVECREWSNPDICFDPMYSAGTDKFSHRGFPLELQENKHKSTFKAGKIKPNVQAMWWQGQPDISAYDRLRDSQDYTFNSNVFPFFASNKFSPFNSQNTIVSKEVLPYWFMFPFISRYDDIFGSLWVEANGFKPIYTAPNVIQDRNPHDTMEDFKQEFWGYTNVMKFIKGINDSVDRLYKLIPELSYNSYLEYRKIFE